VCGGLLGLVSRRTRGEPLGFLGDHPGKVAGACVHGSHDFSSLSARTASRFERAGVTVELAGSVAIKAIGRRAVPLHRIAATSTPQWLASRTVILIAIMVEHEGRSLEDTI